MPENPEETAADTESRQPPRPPPNWPLPNRPPAAEFAAGGTPSAGASCSRSPLDRALTASNQPVPVTPPDLTTVPE